MEIKDKPESMSVREWITKKIATGIIIPENVIKRVISHQFDSAYEALKENNSIEISGFGKFYYNTKKANKQLEYYKEQKVAYKEQLKSIETTEKERLKADKQLKWVEKHLDYLEKERK